MLAVLTPNDAKAEFRSDRAPRVQLQPEIGSAVYVRVDSDRTLVVTPKVHFATRREGDVTNINVVYIADSWTSASVDIRTAATKKVHERRDELNVGLRRTLGYLELSAGYRLSHEIDYVSSAGSLGLRYDAFQRTTTLEARISGARDIVRRSGDDFFQRDTTSLGIWLGWTQILTKTTLLQLSYENRTAFGYLASPYRYVAIGGGGHCGPTALLCLPEVHPRLRMRHAGVVRVRQAMGGEFSIGVAYRFYRDDWKLQSHTGMADLRWQPKKWATLALDYRLYRQSSTWFYEAIYDDLESGQYVTRDRELSAMHSQRIGARMEFTPTLGRQARWQLVTGLMISGSVVRYPDFIDLDVVRSMESSLQLGLRF